MITNPATACEPPKGYAQTLSLLFAYATKGKRILEFGVTTNLEEASRHVPQPARLAANRGIHLLWERSDEDAQSRLSTVSRFLSARYRDLLPVHKE